MISNSEGRKTIAKFIAVGSLAFALNYVALELFLGALELNKILSAVLAMILTIHMTFILHNKWTYKRTQAFYVPLWKRYISYLSTNSTGAVITIVGFSILSSFMINILALGISALLAMIWNFFMNLIVWRHSKKVTADIVTTLN